MKKKIIRITTLFIAVFALTGCFSLYSLSLPENADMSPDTENNWTIKYYVDNYGIPTDKKYVETSFVGAFSNSATTGNLCVGLFRVNDSDRIEIDIYEYGEYIASGFGVEDTYYLTVKDDNDNVLATAEAWLGDDRFTIRNNANDIIAAIATHDHVKMRLVGGKYSKSSYSFGFNTTGFASKAQDVIN